MKRTNRTGREDRLETWTNPPVFHSNLVYINPVSSGSHFYEYVFAIDDECVSATLVFVSSMKRVLPRAVHCRHVDQSMAIDPCRRTRFTRGGAGLGETADNTMTI